MVVGCDWSATGCRYSVTVALSWVSIVIFETPGKVHVLCILHIPIEASFSVGILSLELKDIV